MKKLALAVVAAMVPCLFQSVIPVVAHSQEQSGDATRAPLGGVVSSNLNPLQIAQLHWYHANRTTSFAAGSSPFGVAFDGANMWVANFGTNQVTKLRQ